jgi:two-component system nitrate/nitrite response regulator NarL
MAEDKIRVLLVDDHTLFRSGIRSLLQSYACFEVVG